MTLDEEIKRVKETIQRERAALEKLEREREDRKVKAVLRKLRRDALEESREMSDDHILLLLAVTADSWDAGDPPGRRQIIFGLQRMEDAIAATRHGMCKAYDKYKAFREEMP